MARKKSKGIAGVFHIVAALAILGGVATATNFGDQIVSAKSMPKLVMTQGAKTAKCDQNTVETIVGTLGCGSVEKATKLSRITFTSAAKKD